MARLRSDSTMPPARATEPEASKNREVARPMTTLPDGDVEDEPTSVLHKHPKTRRFVQVENAVVRDPDLSLKATGILVLLLALPPGHPVGSRVIAGMKPDGRHAVRSGLAELRMKGHIHQEIIRRDDGTFVTVTHVYEMPEDNPHIHPPGSGFPTPADRTPDNRATTKTNLNTGGNTDGDPFGSDDDAPVAASSSTDPVSATFHHLARLHADDQTSFRVSRAVYEAGCVKRFRIERKADLAELMHARPDASPEDYAFWLYHRADPASL